MTYIDVFNGDADGICALQQLRLAHPRQSTLVTGVKRDISLLKRVDAQVGDEVTVLDVSLDKNRQPLLELLARGAHVSYFDHHFAGEMPAHELFSSHIDTTPETCTSLIVDRHLQGAHRAWAVVGAFGDNFDLSARTAAQPLGLAGDEVDLLRQLGICLNYNGYGAAIDDLYYPPADLYRHLHPYTDPLAFIAEVPEVFETLRAGSREDVNRAKGVAAELVNDQVALFIFPAEAWARRVSGVYSNELASTYPDRAHALLTQLPQGGYLVSVRAPLNNKGGADDLCRAFPTGGGRKAAAGINHLPEDQLSLFIDQFQARYGY